MVEEQENNQEKEEVTEEQKLIYNLYQENKEKEEIIDDFVKFSDQININKTLFKGIKLILTKLESQNVQLQSIKELLGKRDGNNK